VAKDAERRRFVQLADRLSSSKDPAEQERIKEELARLTFGDWASSISASLRG